MTDRILIPKAKSEQARWLQQLAGAAVVPVFIDPWQIERLPESAEQRTLWLNLDQYSGVICVSPSAAAALTHALDQYWPMPPAGVHWLCNGPRTARTLSEGGLSPDFPATGHTAEDVLQLPQTAVTPGDKWLVVRGEGGRTVYPEVLRARGADVTELEVYRRGLNSDSLQALQQQAIEADCFWLSSQFLGEALWQQAGSFWSQWPGCWWASSERLADWLRAQGCSKVAVAPGATPEALLMLAGKAGREDTLS